MMGDFQESVLDSGPNIKEMAQNSMDGPNVNRAFYALVKKKLNNDYDPSIINIGSCGLHVVHNSFETDQRRGVLVKWMLTEGWR